MSVQEEKRALLVAAGAPVSGALLRRLAAASHFVAAADGGYIACREAGVAPCLLVGDMDSLPCAVPAGGPAVERLPVEKDDTDTVFALRRLLALGYRQIDLVGALGGRLDHTLANLHALVFLLRRGAHGRLLDDGCCCEAFLPGSHTLEREGYALFSLFPLGGACEDVTIEGAKYPLKGYRLENSFPIGVSNRFLAGDARVSFTGGELLAIRLREG